QGGLAAAGRAQEADELALGDIKTDIAERGEVAVALVEVADLEVLGHSKGRRYLASPVIRGRWPRGGRRGKAAVTASPISDLKLHRSGLRLAPSLPSPV